MNEKKISLIKEEVNFVNSEDSGCDCGPSQSSCCTPSQSSCCTPSQSSCCTPSSPKMTVDIPKRSKDDEKLLVDIYVPLEACSCEWSQFMNLIFSTITPYMKYISHETRSINSDEARSLGIHGKCVMVEGKRKYTSSQELKKDLPELLKEKGLI